MLSPREWLKVKFPEYETDRGMTGHDDIHQEKMMSEYAVYYAAQQSVQADGATWESLGAGNDDNEPNQAYGADE